MEKVTRVFLADGSRDFLDLLRAELELQPDLSVVGCAVRGDDAYAQLTVLRPDVMVTDFLLPGLDGLSLLRRLKKEERMPCTLVVSAFVNVYIAQAASLLGVRDYLPKPCGIDELVVRIREAANTRRQPALRGFDTAIREALSAFGVPANLNGRRYLEEALRRALQDRGVLHGITKILYPDLARYFGTTAVCIERSIRSAVFRGWEQGSAERRREHFGDAFDCFTEAPSNAKFISAVAAFIELEFERQDVWKQS